MSSMATKLLYQKIISNYYWKKEMFSEEYHFFWNLTSRILSNFTNLNTQYLISGNVLTANALRICDNIQLSPENGKSMQKHSLKNVPLICSVKCAGRTKNPISWLHTVPQGLIWQLVCTGKFAKKVTCHYLEKKHSISSTFYIRKRIIETSNL